MAVALGESTYFLRTLALLGLQLMGIYYLMVSTAYNPSDENCKPALMDSCMCFRGEGLQTQKDQKIEMFHRKALHPFGSQGNAAFFFPDPKFATIFLQLYLRFSGDFF